MSKRHDRHACRAYRLPVSDSGVLVSRPGEALASFLGEADPH